MKNGIKELKNFMVDDEMIPSRFAMWNMVLFGCEMVMLGSKNVWVKAACVLLTGAGAFAMNNEMAKFMEVVVSRRVGRTVTI